MDKPSESTSPEMRQRKSEWFAGLLSLLLTGLGQIYAGRWLRGFILWTCSALIALIGLALGARLESLSLIVLTVIATVAIWVIGVVDAWQLVRRGKAKSSRSKFDGWYTYVAVLVLWAFTGAPMYRRELRAHVGQTFKIPSDAMAPTLETGDFLLATPKRDPSQREELVIYADTNGPFVKRVVAVAGDTVEMRGGVLFVGGKAVSEPYRQPEKEDLVAGEFAWQRRFVVRKSDTTNYRPSLMTWGPLLVPRGKLFLLGDNRGDSMDSRYLGFTDADSVRLSPRLLYFSFDPSSHTVRWNRIGRRFE